MTTDSDDIAALRAALRRGALNAVRVLEGLLGSDDERVRLEAAAVLSRLGAVIGTARRRATRATSHELADAFSRARAAIEQSDDREA